MGTQKCDGTAAEVTESKRIAARHASKKRRIHLVVTEIKRLFALYNIDTVS